MAEKFRNEGIIQHGGHIEAEQIAVGNRAIAEKVVNQTSETLRERGQAEISSALNALMTAVHQSEAQLAEAKQVYEALENLAAELEKQEPNGVTVKGLLSGITDASKTVESVVSAATKLSALLAALF